MEKLQFHVNTAGSTFLRPYFVKTNRNFEKKYQFFEKAKIE